MANTAITNQITSVANEYGVPPAIALAVAQQESGFNQGAVGAAGEIGVFQLMPATAAGLGVDPSDLAQNIQGGIAFLAQLFDKYGSWPAALSAYNSGSPTGSPSYASSVLSIAGGVPTYYPGTTVDMGTTSPFDDISADWIIGGILLAIFGVLWWVRE